MGTNNKNYVCDGETVKISEAVRRGLYTDIRELYIYTVAVTWEP